MTDSIRIDREVRRIGGVEMWGFVEEPVDAATFLEMRGDADSIIHM